MKGVNKMANYEIKKETIYADMAKLNSEDIKAIKNYKLLGYKLVAITNKEEKKIVRINPEYIETNYPEQYKEFVKIKEQVKKDENGNIKYHIINKGKENERKGEPYKLGAIGALQWFKSNYPENIEEIKELVDCEIKRVHKNNKKDKVKDLKTAYNEYVKKNKDNENKQTMEQYVRCYYWNKIFEVEEK